MRVAAYTGGVMVPSARARVRQYISPLRQLGIQVREYPLPWGNILPRSVALRPMWMAATAFSRAAALTFSWNADVTWISRQLLPAFTPIQSMARRPIILDVDDAVWLNAGGQRARALAKASDVVVCGNSFLANQFCRWNPNVIVIPTAVDTAWYRPQPAAPDSAEDDPTALVLGWTGTSRNFPFLYAIEPALLRVFDRCARARLLVIADRPPRFRLLPQSRLEFEHWSPQIELAGFARMAIGLMPLEDSDWCRGKCSYKMLCYMAAGLPVIVTAAGMNCEVLALGEIGLSAGSEPQWVEALMVLLSNATLRRRMGAVGRAVVEERFSLQRLTQQYAAVFRSLGDPSSQGHSLSERI
ncbi:MAG: glycosyltransferase family 4 protein [Acidobacteriaceae bacterium]